MVPVLKVVVSTYITMLQHLKQHVKIHIIELGYTSDASHTDSLSRKKTQHTHLASHLLSYGWTLAPSAPSPHTPLPMDPNPLDLSQDALPPHLPATIPDYSSHVHIILISSSGVIFKPTDVILSQLGLSPTEIDKLLRTLHSLTITSLHTITKLRRRRRPTQA